MEKHLLDPLNREHASKDSILDSADDRLSLRTRRKPVLTRRRLFILITILVVLGISGGAIYFIFSVARYFWRLVFDPHWGATTPYPYDVVTSYYGENIPEFDVVASVFVRFGKKFPGINESDLHVDLPPETWSFGDWQPLYSQAVFSRISLNSTDTVFTKTIDLPIPLDVLSQFYEPHTFFPEIVNTFVIVPSDPDPILNSPNPPRVEMVEFVPWRPSFYKPKVTSQIKNGIQQLARPMDPVLDPPQDNLRLENASRSLNAFYDSGAVKEFALRPVIDEQVVWDRSGWFDEDDPRLGQNKEMEGAMHESRFIICKRDANLKIKSRSWLSMVKDTPKYDRVEYDRKRHYADSRHTTFQTDPLNMWIDLRRVPFKGMGHFRSLIIQHSDRSSSREPTEEQWSYSPEEASFYGPYMTMHDHAAGSEDWITLPRINESSNIQADPFVVPWHITFDLVSKSKIIAVEKINRDDSIWLDLYIPYDPFGGDGYSEALTLQMRDFINAILGISHTYSKRPILRPVFFIIGGLIRYPLGCILQMYYLFSRSSSTGLSPPSTILYVCFSSLYEVISYHRHRYDHDSSAWMLAAVQVINIISIWRWACLWWGIGFKWNGGSDSIPVGLERFGRTHSERTSRRADQKFTWAQRGVLVVILTIILTHLPGLTDYISLTYLEVPLSYYQRHESSGFFHTVATWSRKLRLSEYGESLKTSLSIMAVSAQALLNWRMGTFAGSFPAFAWTQVVGTILLWMPTVFHSIFGKFQETDPLRMSDVLRFLLDLVILWQAVNSPTVNQEEEEDE